jgi:hypothetical protein
MAYTNADVKALCKGRTPEQQNVIKYFLSGGGCLAKTMTDVEYDALVKKTVADLNLKQKALNKIGVDESQVNEIEPVHFEWFVVDKKFPSKRGKDRIWRTPAYQVSWLFFSATQVYVYQYTLHLNEDSKNERTEEYFYKDITNFSTSSESIDQEIPEWSGCLNKKIKSYSHETIEEDKFALIVPGDKFTCSMKKDDSTEGVIQAMKAKLREKKQ